MAVTSQSGEVPRMEQGGGAGGGEAGHGRSQDACLQSLCPKHLGSVALRTVFLPEGQGGPDPHHAAPPGRPGLGAVPRAGTPGPSRWGPQVAEFRFLLVSRISGSVTHTCRNSRGLGGAAGTTEGTQGPPPVTRPARIPPVCLGHVAFVAVVHPLRMPTCP